MATQLSRTVLVTGSSQGLGLEFVRQFAIAEIPPEVIIATCRNPDEATVSIIIIIIIITIIFPLQD